MADAAASFARLAATLVREGGVEDAAASGRKGFGSNGLMVGGKLFAFVGSAGKLVLKLPRERVALLAARGEGAPFDPGHGRVMKEWIALDGAERSWPALAREARDFVAGQPTPARSGSAGERRKAPPPPGNRGANKGSRGSGRSGS